MKQNSLSIKEFFSCKICKFKYTFTVNLEDLLIGYFYVKGKVGICSVNPLKFYDACSTCYADYFFPFMNNSSKQINIKKMASWINYQQLRENRLMRRHRSLEYDSNLFFYVPSFLIDKLYNQ